MNKPPTKMPLLKATNQRGKLYVVVYAFVIGILLLAVCANAAGAMSGFTLLLFSLVGVAVLVLAVYTAQAIRCPDCKLSWLHWSMSNNPSSQWLNWLLETTSCPKCGFSIGKVSTPEVTVEEK
jgi:hypothetical protein